MAYFPDLVPYVYGGVAPRGSLLTVGWLDAAHGFPRGDVEPDLRALLLQIAADGRVVSRATYGVHECPFCARAPGGETSGPRTSFAELRVEVGGVIYAAPALVVHYMLAHRYAPPAPFVEGLRALRFVDENGARIEPSGAPTASLIVVNGRAVGQTFAIRPALVLGIDEGTLAEVPASAADRVVVSFALAEGGRVRLTGLRPDARVAVNGDAVSTAELRAGDRIEVEGITLKLFVEPRGLHRGA